MKEQKVRASLPMPACLAKETYHSRQEPSFTGTYLFLHINDLFLMYLIKYQGNTTVVINSEFRSVQGSWNYSSIFAFMRLCTFTIFLRPVPAQVCLLFLLKSLCINF